MTPAERHVLTLAKAYAQAQNSPRADVLRTRLALLEAVRLLAREERAQAKEAAEP